MLFEKHCKCNYHILSTSCVFDVAWFSLYRWLHFIFLMPLQGSRYYTHCTGEAPSTAQVRKVRLPQSCPCRSVTGPKAGRHPELLRFHSIHLSQPEVAGADEGGLWVIRTPGLPKPWRTWFHLLWDGLWDPPSASAQWLSCLSPGHSLYLQQCALSSGPQVAFTCISKGFAESGRETLCPWETRQANSSKTVNCRQVVTGNMVGVDVYLVRLRNEQGRERVQEWWLQECPAGDVSCPDLCWDVPEHGWVRRWRWSAEKEELKS